MLPIVDGFGGRSTFLLEKGTLNGFSINMKQLKSQVSIDDDLEL